MHVWACKVVSGEFVRGQVHASHCLHRMGGMGALQQIQTMDGCMRLIVYPGWGNGRSRHWIKTQNAITFPAFCSVFSSMLRWIFIPTGQAQHTRAAQPGSSISLVGSSYTLNLTVDLEVHGSIIQLGLTFRHKNGHTKLKRANFASFRQDEAALDSGKSLNNCSIKVIISSLNWPLQLDHKTHTWKEGSLLRKLSADGCFNWML